MDESIGSAALRALLEALAIVGVILLAFIAAIFKLSKKTR